MPEPLITQAKYLDSSFDKELEKIDNLKWLPWIGKHFRQQQQRIFILGESHYNWDGKKSEPVVNNELFTRYVISNQALSHLQPQQKQYWRIFRNLEKAYHQDGQVTGPQRLNLWSSVVYNNLVQARAMPSPKDRPTDHDYEKGWEVTLDTIRIVHPTLCLVLGTEHNKIKRLERFMTNSRWEYQPIQYVEKVGRCWMKRTEVEIFKSKTIPFLFIKHPSSFFSWKKWGEQLSQYLV